MRMAQETGNRRPNTERRKGDSESSNHPGRGGHPAGSHARTREADTPGLSPAPPHCCGTILYLDTSLALA